MKKSLIFCTLVIVAALSACKNKENLYILNVPPTVDVVSGADIAFKAIGGEGTIEVAPTEGQLQATTSQSWCHLTVEGNKIHVSVDENVSIESRYAKVEMKAGEATGVTTVHQFGIIVKSFSPDDIAFRNAADEADILYDANETALQASTDADWVTLDYSSLNHLVVKVAENASKEYREAEVHWNIGEVKGTFYVSQFDLADAGLLGDWTFYAVNASTGRAFSYYPLDAVLSEASNGTYTLAITKQSGNVDVDYNITGLVLQKNRLMLPLGERIGTHKPNQNTQYQVFPLFAVGTTSVLYENAVTSGYFPFDIEKDSETGVWKATGDASSFEDMVFRFEFWSDKSHQGASNSRTALKDIYMIKN